MLRFKKNWYQKGTAASAQGSINHDQRPGIIISISLLGGSAGWKFEWPSTGASYYRIVLRGRQLQIVVDETNGMQSYVYDGAGFIDYPPPLEIMEEAAVALSELNEPFLVVQWYASANADHYLVEELVDGDWVEVFETAEVGSSVYSWSSPLLEDGTTHNYRVTAYNAIGQGSTPLAFDITPVVTPPDFVESAYSISYNSSTHEITLAVVS